MVKVKLGMQVGLDPLRIALDGDPAPPPKKRGHSATASQFSAQVYCRQAAVCIGIPLGTEVGLSLDDIVLDGNPAKGAQPSNRHLIAAYYGIDLSTSKG